MYYGLLGILTLLPLVSPLPVRAEAPSPVVFSEVNWAGSGASTADEWFELANIGSSMIDLSGWSANGIVLGTGTSIPAYGTLLIANYDQTNDKSTLATAPNIVTTAVSLANSSLELYLKKPDGTAVDSYLMGIKPMSGSTAPYASAERNLQTLGWHTATSTVDLKNATQLGTPGVITLSSPTAEPIVVMANEETVAAIEPVPIPDPLLDVAPETALIPPSTEAADDRLVTTNSDESSTAASTPIADTVVDEPLPTPVADPCLTCPVQIVNIAPTSDTQVMTPESTVSVTPAPAPIIPVARSYPAHSVLINEFVSDPVDGIEWIEIINSTNNTIDLTGWTEKDGSTNKTVLPSQTLVPHDFFVLLNLKGKLNNDGDSIFLFDGTGIMIDAISYNKTSAPAKGKSLARQENGAWAETDPTPKEVNNSPEIYETTNNTPAVINPDPAVQNQVQGTDPDASAPSPVRLELATTLPDSVTDHPPTPESPHLASPLTGRGTTLTVLDATELDDVPDGEIVTVDGVVIGLPGVFGKQLMYLDGLEVYFNKADWPKLKYMAHVQVTGVVQQKTGYARLKISKRSDIKTTGQDALAPDSLGSLDDAIQGGYFSLEGSVTDMAKGGVKVELENGDAIAITAAPHVAINFTDLAFGDRIAVTGVARVKSGVWTLAITETEGMTVLTGSIHGSTPTAPAVAPSPGLSPGGERNHNLIVPPPTKQIPWVGGGLLTTSLGALGYWLAKAKGITLPLIS